MGGPAGGLGISIGSSGLGPNGGGLTGMLADQGVPFIQRHGPDPYVPPHLIDHPRNMARLIEAGCDRVLAVSSVGSTRPEIPVASLVCPDDYIALSGAGSAFADTRGHGTRPLS